jgi:hypothetical protein
MHQQVFWRLKNFSILCWFHFFDILQQKEYSTWQAGSFIWTQKASLLTLACKNTNNTIIRLLG